MKFDVLIVNANVVDGTGNPMVSSDGTSIAPYDPLGVGKPHPRFYGTFPSLFRK